MCVYIQDDVESLWGPWKATSDDHKPTALQSGVTHSLFHTRINFLPGYRKTSS